jgi:hypothetical protein
MKRLDQGHLNSELEIPGLTCPDRESNLGLHCGGEYSRKESFEQLVSCNSEHLHMSARPVENARDMYIIYDECTEQSRFSHSVSLFLGAGPKFFV